MTFAEFFIFIALAFALYLILRPMHTRLERFFYKIFVPRNRKNGPIIDVTDYKKKKDDK